MHWERVDGMNSLCKKKQLSFGVQPANRCYGCGRARFYTLWKEIPGDEKPWVCISKKCELNIPQNPFQNKLLEDLLFQSLYFILQKDLQTNKKKGKSKSVHKAAILPVIFSSLSVHMNHTTSSFLSHLRYTLLRTLSCASWHFYTYSLWSLSLYYN